MQLFVGYVDNLGGPTDSVEVFDLDSLTCSWLPGPSLQFSLYSAVAAPMSGGTFAVTGGIGTRAPLQLNFSRTAVAWPIEIDLFR